MDRTFRQALIAHMAHHKTRVADLVRGSGVSRSTINKLLRAENGSTAVETAMRLAAFYGMTVEDFIKAEDGASVRSLLDLAALLTPEEQRLVEAQVRGILASRGLRSRT